MAMRAMVTGASEGIGRALCLALAAEGWQVTGVARTQERLESLLKELPGRGHGLLQADLAAEAGVAAVEGALAQGSWDLLVNNAGFGVYHPVHEAPRVELDSMLAVNVRALTLLSRAFLAQAQPGACLINISSNLAFLPFAQGAVYAASKAYVTSFSEALWAANRGRGIHVAAVHPGITDTRFHSISFGQAKPLPRLLTQSPEQVAACALKAIKRRSKPTVISGWQNQALAFATRLLSRRSVAALLGRRRGSY
jgi:hypothetical protein